MPMLCVALSNNFPLNQFQSCKERSRAVPERGLPHPAHVLGHRTTTLIEKISVFLKDYDGGTCTGYRELMATHFIAGP
jgi:hypothetical protein